MKKQNTAKNFQALGSAHGFAIHNGWSQWHRSDALTCWHRKVGASTIDYLMEPPSLITKIKSSLSARPIGLGAIPHKMKDLYSKNETGLNKFGLAKFVRVHYLVDLLAWEPSHISTLFTSLEEVIQGLSKSLHHAITYALSHTTRNAPKHSRDIE